MRRDNISGKPKVSVAAIADAYSVRKPSRSVKETNAIASNVPGSSDPNRSRTTWDEIKELITLLQTNAIKSEPLPDLTSHKLRKLSAPAVFLFIENIKALQIQLGVQLKPAKLISRRLIYQLCANQQRNYETYMQQSLKDTLYDPAELDAVSQFDLERFCKLPFEEVCAWLQDMVKPSTVSLFGRDLRRLLKDAYVYHPKSAHDIFNSENYRAIHNAILNYIRAFKAALEFLSFNNKNLIPALYDKDVGLLAIFQSFIVPQRFAKLLYLEAHTTLSNKTNGDKHRFDNVTSFLQAYQERLIINTHRMEGAKAILDGQSTDLYVLSEAEEDKGHIKRYTKDVGQPRSSTPPRTRSSTPSRRVSFESRPATQSLQHVGHNADAPEYIVTSSNDDSSDSEISSDIQFLQAVNDGTTPDVSSPSQVEETYFDDSDFMDDTELAALEQNRSATPPPNNKQRSNKDFGRPIVKQQRDFIDSPCRHQDPKTGRCPHHPKCPYRHQPLKDFPKK